MHKVPDANPEEGVGVEVGPALGFSAGRCTSLTDSAVACAAIWDDALPPDNAG